jgi:MSHA biogenesis protein MshP
MFLKLTNNKIFIHKVKGSALVIAIFIIVVMSLIGSALVRMNSSSAENIAYEVIGTRAYQAAQAGAQRKLREVFPLLPQLLVPNVCPANTLQYDFSTIKGLENCNAINVNCVVDAFVDGVTYYTISSTGQCRVAEVFTSRKIEVKARSL